MKKFLVMIVALCVMGSAAPDRQAPNLPMPEKVNIPELPTGETNWGLLVQKELDFTIDEHPQWLATGTIRADGKVTILWVWRDTGREAPGFYKLTNGKLVGWWGYKDMIQLDETGWLRGGQIYSDVTYRKADEGTPDPVADPP